MQTSKQFKDEPQKTEQNPSTFITNLGNQNHPHDKFFGTHLELKEFVSLTVQM